MNPKNKITNDKIVGKKLVYDFFINKFFENPEFLLHPEESIVFRTCDKARMNFCDLNLSLAYSASLIYKSKIFLGKPLNLLFIEDLALKLDLELLKNIFLKSCHTFNKELYESQDVVHYDREFFQEIFHTHVEKEFGVILYQKYLYYMGSVLENTKERKGQTILQLPFNLSLQMGKQLYLKKRNDKKLSKM